MKSGLVVEAELFKKFVKAALTPGQANGGDRPCEIGVTVPCDEFEVLVGHLNHRQPPRGTKQSRRLFRSRVRISVGLLVDGFRQKRRVNYAAYAFMNQ